jgi:predicted dehydrogenase
MSHELDYIRWIAGEARSVTARLARIGDLAIDVPDLAEIIVDLESGAIGAIHIDMVDRAAVRRCRVVGTDGTITWDGLTGETLLFTAATRQWISLAAGCAEPRGESYVREMEQFLACVGRGGKPTADGEEGLRTLAIAVAAAESAATGRTVSL